MKKLFIILFLLAIVIIAFISLKRPEYMDNFNNNEPKKSAETTKALLKTNYGDIEIELFSDERAPKTVENFINLAKDGFYDGTKFHRVISEFMIQGGDPLTKDDSQKDFWGTGGPGYQFEDEQNNVVLERGVIAMANSGPNTNGSQFFIITAQATPWLQGKHTAFGKVTKGLEFVMEIEKVETEGPDRPIENVVLENVEIIN